MKNTLKFVILFLFLLVTACSPTTSEDFQLQAAEIMERFVKETKKINDPFELKQKENLLKKHFNRLGVVMIKYRKFIEMHPENGYEPSSTLHKAALELKTELYRLYELDGGQNIIEEAQKEAYLKLTLFEQSLKGERIDLFQTNKPISKR